MTYVTDNRRHCIVLTSGMAGRVRQSDTIASVPESKVTCGQTLAKVPIFSGLTEGELVFLAERAVPRRYAAGESVFGEGEPCSGLYVVESGHVRIFKSSSRDANRCSVLMVRAVPSPSCPSLMAGAIPRL